MARVRQSPFLRHRDDVRGSSTMSTPASCARPRHEPTLGSISSSSARKSLANRAGSGVPPEVRRTLDRQEKVGSGDQAAGRGFGGTAEKSTREGGSPMRKAAIVAGLVAALSAVFALPSSCCGRTEVQGPGVLQDRGLQARLDRDRCRSGQAARHGEQLRRRRDGGRDRLQGGQPPPVRRGDLPEHDR